MNLRRRLIAESLGTFALVFVGGGCALMNGAPGAGHGLLGIALAHALVLSVFVTATIGTSGGHLNPAVSMGVLVGRRLALGEASAYPAAQVAGGVLGAIAMKLVLPAAIVQRSGLAVPLVSSAIGLRGALAPEAVLTFLLVSAV